MNRVIFAFTRDLRLSDHAGLAGANRIGPIVPVLVIDAASTQRLRRSPRRAAFFCAAVEALAKALEAARSPLIVRRGQPGPILRELARTTHAVAVGWSVAYDTASLSAASDTQSTLEEAGLRVVGVHDAPVISPEDEAIGHRDGDGYRAFVPYFERWQTVVPVVYSAARFAPHDIPSEPLPKPGEFHSTVTSAEPVSEAAAAVAAERFIELPALSYAAARNVPALAGTSQLSAQIAFGLIAARTIVRAIRVRSQDRFLLSEEKQSLRAFLRAFALRDFFLQLAWHSPDLGDTPLQTKMRGFHFARSHPQLEAWRAGRTGFPIVDAGIRELHATGAMHPRVRSIAASFLCFDLGVDWRIGRDEWDRWLIEDTPALATANWQWIAGVGADLAAYPRIYNPLKQARRFDPAASYVRRWIPELASLPDYTVLDPYAQRTSPQLELDLFGARHYPAPVLDHGAAARAFLARYGREVAAPPE